MSSALFKVQAAAAPRAAASSGGVLFLTALLCLSSPASSPAALPLSATMYSNGGGGYEVTDTSGGLVAINATRGQLEWTVSQDATSGLWHYSYVYTPYTANRNSGVGAIAVQFGQQPADLAWGYAYVGNYAASLGTATTTGTLQTIDRTLAGSVSPYTYDSWLDGTASTTTTRVNVTSTFQGVQWVMDTTAPNGSVSISLELTTSLAPFWGNIYLDGFNQTTNNGYGFIRNTAYDSPTQPFSPDGAIVGGKVPVPGVPTYALTLLFAGSGGGDVNGDLSCTSGATCNPLRVAAGSTLTLMPTPGVNSVFAGWSGACTNSSGNCVIAMDGDKSVTATFNDPDLIRIGSTHYLTLTAAFADAAKGQIMARALEFGENLAVTLATDFRGGLDPGFSGNVGTYTTLAGSLTVRGGSLTVEGLAIR